MKIKYFAMLVPVVLIVSVLVWLWRAEPLVSEGMSTWTIGEQTEYVVEVANNGFADIRLLDVKVNGNQMPAKARLGITYDSGQLVQILPEAPPSIRFMELSAAVVEPRIIGEEAKEAIARKAHTPIHYGIRIQHSEKVRSVTVTYRYLGFVKKADITRWFE